MRAVLATAGVVVLVVAAMFIPPAASAQNEGDVRLVGGSSPNEGRVEVFHAGQWGTVCDDGWDVADAQVVCEQLGFAGASAGICCAEFGQGSGPIWMDDVNCVGNEQRLVDCPFRGPNIFGSHNCAHSEDAGVICFENTPAPALGPAALALSAVALIASGAFVLRRRKQAA